MPTGNNLDLSCDWQRSLNVAPGGKGPYGYVLEWSGLGGLILAKDLVVWNPLSGGGQSLLGGSTITCVGVIERFAFGGEATDPIRISCYLSKENQANLRATLARDLVNVKVRTAWNIVDYDQSAKAWFGAVELLEARQLDSMVNTQDGELQIAVDREPTPVAGTQGIEVYRFELELAPALRRIARIQFALGQSQRIVCAWGDDD